MSRESADKTIEKYTNDNPGAFVSVIAGFAHTPWEVVIYPSGTTDSAVGTGASFREATDEAFTNLPENAREPEPADA